MSYYTADDGESGNYYLDCGCWSGASDHTCAKPGADRCRGCGVPDDCMCHEQCDSPETGNACASCVADYRETLAEDHAEALTEDRQRLITAEDEAVIRLTAGKRSRIVVVQGYTDDGNPWILTNGSDRMMIRPRDCLDGNARLSAVRFARLILSAIPAVTSVQVWDNASGTNVWGLGDNDSGRWFVAYPNRNRDGDPTPILRVTDMSDIDGGGGR